MKKLLLLILTVLSIGSVDAQTHGYAVGDLHVIIVEGEAWIYEYVGNSAAVSIPAQLTLDGKTYNVTGIFESAFAGNKDIQQIVFPETLKEIHYGAFGDCENLWILNFPESLTRIGDYAFTGLKHLQSLRLPNSELEIGNYAFSDCESLFFILVPEKVKSFGDYVFSGCDNLLAAYFLSTSGPAYSHMSFNDIALGAELYYPKGYYDSYSDMWGFSYAYGRTKPAVGLNFVQASGAGTIQLRASAYGYFGATIESIEWESRNEKVASVDQNGRVTTMGPGITDIFCTVTDSNGESESAYCTIKVPENSGVEDIEIAENAIVEYFTLDGLPAGVDRSILAPGIYIRRHGREVSKIIIK